MSFEPNQWRVLTINEDGVDVWFYVFRNPPDSQFYSEAGTRKVFFDRQSAQYLADSLNISSMPSLN